MLPLISISLSKCGGAFPIKWHCFFETHDSLILALGTVLLISGLAVLAAYISKNSSERRDVFNRKIQAELQLAQFRQDWINKMHQDLSKLHELMEGNLDGEGRAWATNLAFAIQTRLNEKNPLAKKVGELIDEYGAALDDKDMNSARMAVDALPTATSLFLKGEWDELNMKLMKAQSVEMNSQ